MKAKRNPRTDSATLSPAAECWWERGDTCIYLKLAVTEQLKRKVVSITEGEARTLRALLNNPKWWTDLEELGN